MPQIVEAKIIKLRPFHRLIPRRVTHCARNARPSIREAVIRMLALFHFQDGNRISI